MNCLCCGGSQWQESSILWPKLIADWRLAEYEVAYTNRQQGSGCVDCGSNLRSMVLAKSILACYSFSGYFKDFVHSDRAENIQVLEINDAGMLTRFLKRIPNHLLVHYPEVDMMSLPFNESQFDLVVHSDTLEHVQNPIQALTECLRVLKPGGSCAFTVPMIVDRLTRTREDLPRSYHGSPDNPPDCLVYTEYGADTWKQVIQAGFEECRIFSLDYPSAQALVGTKETCRIGNERRK